MKKQTKNVIKLIMLTTIGLGSVSCSVQGQLGSYVDRQTGGSEAGMRQYGQNLSDIIYTGKSKGRDDNGKHETYELRHKQEKTVQDGLAWKLRKYLKLDAPTGGQ